MYMNPVRSVELGWGRAVKWYVGFVCANRGWLMVGRGVYRRWPDWYKRGLVSYMFICTSVQLFKYKHFAVHSSSYTQAHRNVLRLS